MPEVVGLWEGTADASIRLCESSLLAKIGTQSVLQCVARPTLLDRRRLSRHAAQT